MIRGNETKREEFGETNTKSSFPKNTA